MKVGVPLARRSAESAEATADEADVRKIYVAIDDVCNDITHSLAAHAVSGKYERFKLCVCGSGKLQTLFEIEFFA
jgi:hypothetical protein